MTPDLTNETFLTALDEAIDLYEEVHPVIDVNEWLDEILEHATYPLKDNDIDVQEDGIDALLDYVSDELLYSIDDVLIYDNEVDSLAHNIGFRKLDEIREEYNIRDTRVVVALYLQNEINNILYDIFHSAERLLR